MYITIAGEHIMGIFINLPDYQNLDFWLSCFFIAVALIAVVYFILRHIKRIFVTLFYFIIVPVILAFYVLTLLPAFYTTLGIFAAATIIFVLLNIPEFRSLISNPPIKQVTFLGFPTKNKGRSGKAPQEMYDLEAVVKEIETAVENLSKTKTGALITIEGSDTLENTIKNGTLIDAEVNSALLQSIFYKGTILHDGAVVIRGHKIIAAAVYFVPTTKGLMGKVGSRHRAAIGISDMNDSVSVIVSEETGRISIAYRGALQSVTIDKFERVLTDALYSRIKQKDK